MDERIDDRCRHHGADGDVCRPRYLGLGALLVGGLLAAVLLVGCGSLATRKDFYNPITAELQAGRYDSAAVSLEAARKSGKFDEKDRFVYYTDAGLAYHYAGLFDTSNNRLHQAESAAEELFTRSISRAALSFLLNDNVLEYAGEDHEILYGNLFSALNYLSLGKFDDAFVEIRRANLKLEQLEQKYADASVLLNRGRAEDTSAVPITYEAKKVRFYNSAFGRYLSMHLYAAEGKYDDARIDYDFLTEAFRTQPFIYDFALPEVRYQSDSGAILSVVALAGLAPVKESWALRIRTDKDLNLVQVLYTDTKTGQEAVFEQIPLPVSQDYYFKFAIPRLVDRLSDISAVKVYANGNVLGQLQLLENVGSVARETFQAKSSLIYLRTVARAVAKGLTAHKAKTNADTGGLGGWLKKAAIDVATDISENADIRCSRLLPGRILVGDFVLPPGTYDLRVEFLGAGNQVVGSQSYPRVTVTAGGLNLIEAVSLK